jgi:hypothetical protein
MTRPGTPSYVGSCRECGVVNGHSGSCRVDLIVEGITRGLRREGYILIEACHHAELVRLLKEARGWVRGSFVNDIDAVLAKIGSGSRTVQVREFDGEGEERWRTETRQAEGGQ